MNLRTRRVYSCTKSKVYEVLIKQIYIIIFFKKQISLANILIRYLVIELKHVYLLKLFMTLLNAKIYVIKLF